MKTSGNFCCVITGEPFQDPVVASDGFTYERAAIEQWIKINLTSPMTREPLAAGQLLPNRTLLSSLQESKPFAVRWHDAAHDVEGTEVFSHAKTTACKLKRRLGAVALHNENKLLADDAVLPFGACVQVTRPAAATFANQKPPTDAHKRSVRVQIGLEAPFWLAVKSETPLSEKQVQAAVRAEQERRGLLMPPDAMCCETAQMTSWRANVMGPVMPVCLAPGCHGFSCQGNLFRVVTPYSPQRVLSKAAKRLVVVNIDVLTLQQHKDQLRVVVACAQPACTPYVIPNLTTKQDVHIEINPAWTVDHLLVHVAMVVHTAVRVYFLDALSHKTLLADNCVIGQLGECVMAHEIEEVTVRLAKGCCDWPDRGKFSLGVARQTTPEDVCWQMSRLLRRPLDHVVAIAESPMLIIVHVRCAMAEPTMVVMINVDPGTDAEQQVRLDVEPSWTADHVKCHLALLGHDAQTKLGKRQLYSEMTELNDDDTLADHDVVDGQRLMWSRPFVWLRIRAAGSFLTGLHSPLDATVAELERQLQSRVSSPATEDVKHDYELSFEGQLLDNAHRTLRSYNIVPHSWIDMERPIDVTVLMCGAQPVVLKAWRTKTVLDFRACVLFDAVKSTLVGKFKRHHLFFHGRRLNPKHTLRECQVENAATLQFLIGRKISLCITRHECQDVLANVDSGWTIADLKRSLANVSRLFLGSKELTDDRTIESYDIQHGTTISADDNAEALSDCKEACRNRIVLTISCAGDDNMSLLVDKDWTVAELKIAIEKNAHHKHANQRLTFANQELADDRTVGSYHFADVDTVHCSDVTKSATSTTATLLQNIDCEPRVLCIVLPFFFTCQTLNLTVAGNKTVAEIKAQIEQERGLETCKYVLRFCGENMADCRTIASFHIKANDLTFLSLCLQTEEITTIDCPNRVKMATILVHVINGLTFELTVDVVSVTVACLKGQIYREHGARLPRDVSRNEMQLIYKGVILSEEDRTLESFGVPKRCTMFLKRKKVHPTQP